MSAAAASAVASVSKMELSRADQSGPGAQSAPTVVYNGRSVSLAEASIAGKQLALTRGITAVFGAVNSPMPVDLTQIISGYALPIIRLENRRLTSAELAAYASDGTLEGVYVNAETTIDGIPVATKHEIRKHFPAHPRLLEVYGLPCLFCVAGQERVRPNLPTPPHLGDLPQSAAYQLPTTAACMQAGYPSAIESSIGRQFHSGMTYGENLFTREAGAPTLQGPDRAHGLDQFLGWGCGIPNGLAMFARALAIFLVPDTDVRGKKKAYIAFLNPYVEEINAAAAGRRQYSGKEYTVEEFRLIQEVRLAFHNIPRLLESYNETREEALQRRDLTPAQKARIEKFFQPLGDVGPDMSRMRNTLVPQVFREILGSGYLSDRTRADLQTLQLDEVQDRPIRIDPARGLSIFQNCIREFA